MGPGGVPGFGDTAARAAAAVDVAVLQELQGIRREIGKLSERLALSATRDDLDDYVRKDVFDGLRRDLEEHVRGHQRMLDGWRGWVPVALAGFAIAWNVIGPYVHFGLR